MNEDTIDFADLYTEHHHKIVSYFHRRTGSLWHAEDLAQDTFLRALAATQNDTGAHTHQTGWLYRIARNAAVDTYRSNGRTPDMVDIDVIDEAEKTAAPDELAVKNELRSVLQGAIEKLPDFQALAVTLRLEGYEIAEIADEIGKSVGATKGLLHRGIEKLFTELSAYMGVEGERDAKRMTCAPAVRQYLIDNHPMTMREIVTGLRLTASQVNTAFFRHPDIFVRLGKRERPRGDALNIWGVRGIHDGEVA